MDNNFNRSDPAKHYDRHLCLPDRVLQSAELNELQSNLTARTADIASAFFSDGAIIRDATCIVRETGHADLESGAARAYLAQPEIRPDVDRVIAVYPDGRAYGWHQLNDKTPERGVMD